jgi:hypothetical protein
MNTELKRLKELIVITLKKDADSDTLKLLAEEAKALPDAITANIFGLTDYAIRQYICWHLDMLVKEADLLYKCCLKQPRLMIKKILVIILNLLETLNRMFPEHAVNSIPLPLILYQKEAARFKLLCAGLVERFQKHDVDRELSRIALFPLSNFLQKTGMPHRYCDYLYLVKFIPILNTLDLTKKGTTAVGDLLCARLVTVNYNSIALMDYYTGKVSQALDQASSRQEREQLLQRMRKWLKQVTVMSGVTYDPYFPNIKESLLDWADQEMEALALLDVSANSGEPEKELEKLEISVGVLAYLTRLSVTHGIRKAKPKTEIAEQVINTYSTKQTGRISKGSFINCYKALRTGVARALRKILRAMLDDVDYFIREGVVRETTVKTDKS